MEDHPFYFLRQNHLQPKPRQTGLTEIRGPYYSAPGRRMLADVLEMMGEYIDSLKFAGGSFSLMNERALRDLIDLAHGYSVEVSTGGFIENVLGQGREAVMRYIYTCRDMGFDIMEISAGFISLPDADWMRLIGAVREAGLKVKAEVGIQFGAGGDTPAGLLNAEGQRDVSMAITQAKRFLDAGAHILMMESEGVTENITPWRTEVPARFMEAVGKENVMFEAADPAVFEWYIKNFGYDVNLFVDHSQIVQLQCLRAGIWGTQSTWGRIMGF